MAIEPRNPSRSSLSASSMRGVVRDIQLTAFKLEGEAALTRRHADLAIELDDYIVMRAGQNERRQIILNQIEQDFLNRTSRLMNARNNPWGF